MSSGLKVQWDI